MTIQSKSYMNFLGGEVSPNVYKRLDMANNGKWFETAKNIYFGTTGDILNRRGFRYIGVAGNGISGEKMKLIPFMFNREQSYCIEFSSNFFRILKDGQYLKDDQDNIIEVSHPGLSLINNNDLSYTQVGDMLYVCNGTQNGIYTITRYSETDWRWSLFDFEIPPMRKVNEDDSKILTFSTGGNYSNSGYFSTDIGPADGVYKDVVVDVLIEGVRTTLYTASSDLNGLAAFVADFNNNIDSSAPIAYARLVEDTVVFYLKTGYTLNNITDLRVKVGAGRNSNIDLVYSDGIPGYSIDSSSTRWYANYSPLPQGALIKKLEVYQFRNHTSNEVGTVPVEKVLLSKTYNEEISPSQARNDIVNDSSYWFGYEIAVGNVPDKYFAFNSNDYRFVTGGMPIGGTPIGTLSPARSSSGVYLKRVIYETTISSDTYYTASTTPISTLTVYTATANFPFFQDKQVGEIFAVDSVYSPSSEGKAGENKTFSSTVSAGESTSSAFWSNGTWRFINSGLFDGYIELQYSYDGVEWFTHRTFSSSIRTESNVSYGTNYNEYGTIETDDNIQLRLHFKLNTATNLRVTLDTESFKNRSYYKIVEKNYLNPDTVAIVSCVKYAIGTPGLTKVDPLTQVDIVNSITEWSEAAWSNTNGYPKVCFLYQNRLGLANTNKDVSTIWFSRTDNYKDFSTKIEYQDDDPITISVLKPTGISEITGVASSKKLFVFSGDREYGIRDEGALTQANKELVSFSSYGSQAIEPRVVSNRIVFVERGGRAARSLVYDYASENYEAPDLTIPFKHLLTNEVVVASEYLPGDYKTYIMLTSLGRLLMFKYIPEQRIEAVSWFKHPAGNITNVCVVSNEASYDMYIALDTDLGKRLEYMHIIPYQTGKYLDSYRIFSFDEPVTTIIIIDGISNKLSSDANGMILLPEPATTVEVGLAYESEATMIPPNFMYQNGTTNYNRKNMFKAHISFLDSVGFQVGVKNKDKSFKKIFALEAQSIEGQHNLYSADRSFVLQSSYLEPNMLSFVQKEPYPMHITNAEIEVDYGGK